MGLRGAQPFVAPRSVAAKRFGRLIIAARMKGFLFTKECGYIYTLKGAVAGHPVLLESLDFEAVQAAVLAVKSVEHWNANEVRHTLANYRLAKERKSAGARVHRAPAPR